jgi:hypothetical protein
MKINLRNGQLVATLFAHEESDLKKTRDHCTMLAALSPTDKNVSDAAKQAVSAISALLSFCGQS